MGYQVKLEIHEGEETLIKVAALLIQRFKRIGGTPLSNLRILSPKNNLSTTTHEMDTSRRCTALSRRENHDHVCDLSHFCLPCTETGALRDGEYCHPAFQSRASGKIERIPLCRSSHPVHPRFPGPPSPTRAMARVEGAYSGERSLWKLRDVDTRSWILDVGMAVVGRTRPVR